MVAYNGGVAILCCATALIVWRMGVLPPWWALVDLVLGVLNAYVAVARWRRERREAEAREGRRWEEWP